MYTVLSPFVIPPGDAKKCNIGDGFILHAVQRLLAPAKCQYVLSTRTPLDRESIEKINCTRGLILAGANQLNDSYSLAPSFRLRDLKKIKVPIIPFGVGYSGEYMRNKRMSRTTRYLLEGIHERIRYSSWRCPFTTDYLQRWLPHLSDKFLMTGCPVVYDTPILGDASFPREIRRAVVTVTERDIFWERERLTLECVAANYGQARKTLALHQMYDDVKGNRDKLSGRMPSDLHAYAESLGFSVYRARNVVETQDLYRETDLHFGSRLHAHLFCLSQAKQSFLTYVDGRCRGISLMYAFPIIDYREPEADLDYDFSICRQQVRYYSRVMNTFTGYVKGRVS